jgi:dimethylargininase
MAVFDFGNAIVRRPGSSVVDGLSAGGGPAPSFDGVRAEHEAYVEALVAAGVSVEALNPLERFPDSIFVEDPALVFPEGAILLRPGAPSRAGEAGEVEPVLRRRFETVLTLDEGYADGGDVLATPDAVHIGLSARTDRAGAEALARLLGELGRSARIVATPAGTLHLKTACALVDEETIFATPDLAASGLFDGYRIVTTPAGEERAANLLRINDRLLVGACWARTIDLLGALGPRIVPLPVSEIARLDAGLSCMSLRW